MFFQAQELRRIRLRLGWSVAEMARRLDCPLDFVFKMESGEDNIPQKYSDQLYHWSNQIEEISSRVAQIPWAETNMNKKSLSQMSQDELWEISP
ncbi:MAG: helix-turn-helix domain-containing protein [Bdellovibrionales bacterium]|nr:helix-turn-helix domain-containing protein [Bdellovibrionales bacterium]